MLLRDMFKKPTYISVTLGEERKEIPIPSTEQKVRESMGEEPSVPEGMWTKCTLCGEMIYTEDLIDNSYVCPKCNGYFRIDARTRISMLLDNGTFEEWDTRMESVNPLNFPEYTEKLGMLKKRTDLDEAVVTGKGSILGEKVVIGVCDTRFLMGSMGHIVGEKITRAIEGATKERLPLILFTCSGGARMQEGIISLMQMAKTSAAIKRHSEEGLLYITVLTDPTTGGVTASFAMLGDIILAEPGALVGFAGPRVIEQTIGQKLPIGFQRAEFILEHGFADAIVERGNMAETLAMLIRVNQKNEMKKLSLKMVSEEDGETYGVSERTNVQHRENESVNKANEGASKVNKNAFKENRIANTVNGKENQVKMENLGTEIKNILTSWDRVQIARSAERPTALDYIEEIFTDFYELHGDRNFRDDAAIVGGVATFSGLPVTVIGQQKGRNTKDNIKRNFGMPYPEGYRKALRLMKQAEKFGRPIICFVDTPGAFCGIEAEERGQGEAIARNLMEMAGITVPILSIVIGEGGSGGALAMAVGNEVWMMENATYSVLSPEGFASILWKDSKRAKEATDVMKITAEDLKILGIIETIIPEGEKATLENMPGICQYIQQKLTGFLNKYQALTNEELVNQRYERFRSL